MKDNIKIGLFIIFNHRFDKNIPILEDLYKDKFSNVYFIVPYYNGDKENVIPVFESSFYFEGYIAQAYQKIKNEGFSHYFFIADDMILNPLITEDTVFDVTGIKKDHCWIYDFRDCKNTKLHHRVPTYTPIKMSGIEVNKMMPPVKDVMQKFDKLGLSYFPSKWYAFQKAFKYLRPHRHCLKPLYDALSYILRVELVDLKSIDDYYPGIWAYSDILMITDDSINNFARYCGMFSGLKVFVENAIPLALIMASDKIQTSKDIKLNAICQLPAMGEEYEKSFIDKYNYSLSDLLNNYPENIFYIHPLKLSKWK